MFIFNLKVAVAWLLNNLFQLELTEIRNIDCVSQSQDNEDIEMPFTLVNSKAKFDVTLGRLNVMCTLPLIVI